ncbi:50S ribosomal protein L4 [Candidatus Woesearchaeota archaeon]|nr:50S ribosomal protein L4 [Candidatus Woesearchaeota archaeon]MBW3021530.1 50S ribosomal protein L4 [Candidatus Woesearchaeota archaeon]
MKVKILNLQGQGTEEIELPGQFNEALNPVLVKRAVQALQSSARQTYGASPEAGKRHSVELSKRRRKYRGCYGHGIARTPRKIMSRRGTRMNWEGAFAPNTKGGRRAHPPKAEKNFEKKINKKENRKAIRSALAATMDKEVVAKRGHKIPEKYPFIINNDFEGLDKTKNVKSALVKLGLDKELERTAKRKVRSGKGKMRGRKYRVKKGLLIVVKDECKLLKSARNILGVDVVQLNQLNAELLAPGADLGRLTLFTKNSIEKMSKEKCFM